MVGSPSNDFCRDPNDSDRYRAGANFSAISGSDENALRWDRLGYSHLTQLASTAGQESFVKRTPSIEYWDEAVSEDKIKSMSEYLEDVSSLSQLVARMGLLT